MKDIKERVRDKNPKIRNPAARLPKELVRSAVLEAKEKPRELHEKSSGQSESPTQYGTEKIESVQYRAASVAGKSIGIHGRRIFVADFNGQLVLAVMAQIRHISAENGVTALVGGGNRSVDLDGSGKGCGQNFNIGAAAGQRLLGRSKGAGTW